MSALASSVHASTAARPAAGHSLWERVLRGLEAIGRARVANEMQRLACCYDGVNPELSRRMREIARSNDQRA